MAPLSGINLIRTKTNLSPQLGAIEQSLRQTAYVGLSLFLCVGVIVGVLYVLFSQEKNRLDDTKQQLVAHVTGSAQKEAMYVAIKSRIHIVGSAIGNQKPWSQLLDRVQSFITPPQLTDISVDDQNNITLTVQASSLEQLATVAQALIDEAKAKRVVNPQLGSFQISNTGKISSTFTFLAVF